MTRLLAISIDACTCSAGRRKRQKARVWPSVALLVLVAPVLVAAK